MNQVEQQLFFKKHCVVFGAGYVGRQVVAKALNYGAQVTALTRNPQTCRELRELGAKVVCNDIATPQWHSSIKEPVDFVLNSVAAGAADMSSYERSYLHGMKSLIDWLCQRAPRRVVYTSSTSVYPQGGSLLVDETFSLAAGNDKSSLLVGAEQLLVEASTNYPFPAVILRLAGIYGPGRHHLLDQILEDCGVFPGRGESHLNLIHRDDIVNAVFIAWSRADHPNVKAYNLVDDGRATRSEIVNWLCEQLGKPRITFSGEPAALRRRITPDRIISNALIKRELGWSPEYSTFREGYAKILSDNKKARLEGRAKDDA
jgi:nucleoside-diphosphate-sugar epimerase